MKLRINYDLLNKIKASSNGISLKKELFWLYLPSSSFTIRSFAEIISLMSKDTSNQDNYLIVLGIMLGLKLIPGTILYAFKKALDPRVKEKANNSLNYLAMKLSWIDVITTSELLKESELLETKYSIKYTDNKLPVLKQDKYISVPLSNGYSETLLQEHIIGTDTYDLSIQEPEKKLELKPSKAGI